MTPKTLLARDPALLRESELSSLVVDVARLAGWKRYHTFDSRKSNHGFPDWVFVKGARIIFAELKSEDGKVRPEQQEWLDLFEGAGWLNPGVEVYVWRPSDWDEIVYALTGRRPVEKAA